MRGLTSEPKGAGASVGTEELRVALAQLFGQDGGTPATVARLVRRPSSYQSSFALEELDVELVGGPRLLMMFKDLGWDQLHPEARRAKPAFLYDPRREIEAYQRILQPRGLGTPAFYGAFVTREEHQYWLFIERVAGVELYQVGGIEVWQVAARWLAAFHLSTNAEDWVRGPWLQYDRTFYERWMTRALAHQRPGAGPPGESSGSLAGLARRYGQVIDRMTQMPATLIHGECYASNVIVDEGRDPIRICPIDWELTAVGPGLVDLAALTSGSWNEEDRRAIALAYYDAWIEAGGRAWSRERFLEDLDYCRLHLAVQWLGWTSHEWMPPLEHRHDWLAEAQMIAERLGL